MQHILVIDDDESLRDTIAVMLDAEGYRVTQAPDGASGVDKALTLKPELLMIDLRLPGLPGVEICKRVRGAGLGMPLLVLSAVGDEVDKVLMLEIGADDDVVKPFGRREVRARIGARLRGAG